MCFGMQETIIPRRFSFTMKLFVDCVGVYVCAKGRFECMHVQNVKDKHLKHHVSLVVS